MSSSLVTNHNKFQLAIPDSLNEKQALAKINEHRTGIETILSTLKNDVEQIEHKFIIAANIYYRREHKQTTPIVIPEGFVSNYSNMSLLYGNQIMPSIAQVPAVRNAHVLVDWEKQSNLESIFDTVLEPFLAAGLSCENDDFDLYVYINTLYYEQYEELDAFISLLYPNARIISRKPQSSTFDPKKHVNIHQSEFANIDVCDLILDFKKHIDSVMCGRDNLLPYIDDKGQRPALTIPEIIMLGDTHNITIRSKYSYDAVLARELARWWFDYDRQTQTFMEFVNDVFSAPSCIRVDTMVDFIGYITEVTLEVNVFDVETEEFQTLLIHSPSEVGAVTRDLVSLLEKNPDNTWDRLIEYEKKIYRVVNSLTFLKAVGASPILQRERVSGTFNIEIPVRDNVQILHDHYYRQQYQALCRLPGVRSTGVPKQFPLYLLRRNHIGSDSTKDLVGVAPEMVDYWKRVNTSLPSTLRALRQIVSIRQLVSTGQFDPVRGLLKNAIIVDLNKLEVPVSGINT